MNSKNYSQQIDFNEIIHDNFSFYLLLAHVHYMCPIYFLDTIHLLFLICILLLIYKLKHSHVEFCLIRLNARIIHINFS